MGENASFYGARRCRVTAVGDSCKGERRKVEKNLESVGGLGISRRLELEKVPMWLATCVVGEHATCTVCSTPSF